MYMYIHVTLNGRIFGGIPEMLVFKCNFLRKLMVSDKKICRAFRTHEYNSINKTH